MLLNWGQTQPVRLFDLNLIFKTVLCVNLVLIIKQQLGVLVFALMTTTMLKMTITLLRQMGKMGRTQEQ